MNRTSHWTWVALTAVVSGSFAQAQTTVRVSVGAGGAQPTSDCSLPSISADSRFVAFSSAAPNLIGGDDNAVADVFVHDRQTWTTECVSRAMDGGSGNSESMNPVISANGRCVAFWSTATNLIAGDTNGTMDVYLRDRQTGTIERVSVSSTGVQGDLSSLRPSLSADGRFVAFESDASNFVVGDTNGLADIFVRDRQAGTTERVSVATDGTEANWFNYYPSISADGRFVAFDSLASNLVPGDTNGWADILVRDRLNGTTERVSIGSGNMQGDYNSHGASMSADGRFVVFESGSSNFVPGDTNGAHDVFVRDRQTGTTERVSVATGGTQGDSHSHSAAISANGRFVAITSGATNLVLGDTNDWRDVFVRDRQSGTTERVSVAANGAQGDGDTFGSTISADGRFSSFRSNSTNLVAGDTNGVWDVFVRDRGQPPVPFCAGDGSAQTCPCGNAGALGHGCANSIDAGGAILSSSGTSSLGDDTLVLTGGGMPDSSALYLQGTDHLLGGQGIAFGDGLRCIGGTIVRLGRKTNVAGSSQYPSGTDAPVSIRGQVTLAGTRTYQIWYRNAATYCTASTFNLANGLLVTWTL